MTSKLGGCVVVDAGGWLAQTLPRSLSMQGFDVALLTDQTFLKDPIPATQTACRFGEKPAVDAAFDRAVATIGAPRVIVVSMLPKTLTQPLGLVEFPTDRWTDGLQTAMLATLYALQACHRVLKDRGGVIVLTGPTASLVGAAGYTALCTLLEAQRALAKSAARQWGGLAIRTHWIAMGQIGNYGDLLQGALPAVPELGPPPPALGRVPSFESDIAPIIEFLSGRGAAALTGTTLVADGGDWMVP